MSMIIQVLVGIILVIVTALATYFVRNVSRSKYVTQSEVHAFVAEQVVTHERIKHQQDMIPYVEKKIKDHEDGCDIKEMSKKLDKLESLIYWLVYSNGGDPKSILEG